MGSAWSAWFRLVRPLGSQAIEIVRPPSGPLCCGYENELSARWGDNPLKRAKRKIRLVLLRSPPIPPYACARDEIAPHAK